MKAKLTALGNQWVLNDSEMNVIGPTFNVKDLVYKNALRYEKIDARECDTGFIDKDIRDCEMQIAQFKKQLADYNTTLENYKQIKAHLIEKKGGRQ